MEIHKENIEHTNIGDLKNIKSSIADENIGLALNMVSKNLYSNPLGSFIRELTSNAVDANVDADETSPVMVHLYTEDDTYFVKVKDKGTGISPEAFEDIYMSWFASDKRKDNKKIGGWGLGSKSPLAYQSSFEITTVYNGIKYEYILSNEDEVPAATLLLTQKTDESNGTTIRVEIKDEDRYEVYRQCKLQLYYFNNVYVKDEKYFYDNNFTIFENDLYKLRTDDHPFHGEMHICLGQVTYPIDWETLELSPIYIPIGLNFNVGDLAVTLSREEINYKNDVISKVKERIEIVRKEIEEKYKEQCNIDDLFTYISLIKDKKKLPLTIKGVSIPVEGLKTILTFNGFKGIKLKANSISNLFSMYNVTVLKSGKKYSNENNSNHYHHLYNHPSSCYMVHDKINYYDALYINNGKLFQRGTLSKARYRIIGTALGLISYDYVEKGKSKYIVQTGASKIILEFVNYLDNYLKRKIQQHEGQAPSYWIEEQKALKKEVKEKVKGEITHYDIHNKRKKVMLKDLLENNKFIFVINKDINKEIIVNYNALYEKGNVYLKKNAAFIIASTTVLTKLKKHKHVYDAADMFKIKSFKHLLYRMYISDIVKHKIKPFSKLNTYSDYYSNMYGLLFIAYNETYETNYYNVPDNGKVKRTYGVNLLEYFNLQIKTIVNSIEPKKYVEYIPLLEEYYKKLSFLSYVNNAPHSELVEYIKTLKVLKLNSIYYDKDYIKSHY